MDSKIIHCMRPSPFFHQRKLYLFHLIHGFSFWKSKAKKVVKLPSYLCNSPKKAFFVRIQKLSWDQTLRQPLKWEASPWSPPGSKYPYPSKSQRQLLAMYFTLHSTLSFFLCFHWMNIWWSISSLFWVRKGVRISPLKSTNVRV